MFYRGNYRLTGFLLLFGMLLPAWEHPRCHGQDFDAPSDPTAAEAGSPGDRPAAMRELLKKDDVLTELQFNNQQRQKIKELIEGYERNIEEAQKNNREKLKAISSIAERLRKRSEFRGEIRRQADESWKNTEKSLLDLLDAQQQATLEKKVGEFAFADSTDSPTKRPSSRSTTRSSTPPAVRTADTVANFSANNEKKDPTPKPGSGDAPVAESPSKQANATATNKQIKSAKLSFNFHAAPWTDVLKLFSEAAGLTLNLKNTPPGTFTYYDRQEYTPTQALDIMNRFLLQDGFILVRHDQFLTVFDTSGGIPPNLIDTVSPEELKLRGSTELVRIALPLGDRKVSKAAEEIRALLGPQGKVAPLESANSIVVTDIAANLRRVKQLLEPPPKVGAEEFTFQAFPLSHIDAPTAADIIRSLFGLQGGVQNVSGGQSNGSSSSRRSRRSRFEDFFRSRGGRGRNGESNGRGDRGSASQPSNSTKQSKAKVAIDQRTNSVLVTSTAAEMKLVEEIVEAIDVSPDEAGGFESRPSLSEPNLVVYELKSADAREVSKTLSVLHPGMVVNVDGRARRVHIWATPEQHRQIAAHIQQLDGAASGELLAILPMSGLNAYDVSVSLTSLYANDATGAPTFQLDPSGRGLIVKGSIVRISQIRALVEQMAAQRPTTSQSQRTVRVVPMGTGESAFVQQAIGALYPQVSISTTVTASTTSSNESSSDRRRNRNGSRARSSEDQERIERIRRFMERGDRSRRGRGRGSRNRENSSP